MKRTGFVLACSFAVCSVLTSAQSTRRAEPRAASASAAAPAAETAVLARIDERFAADLEAMRTYRPGFAFWQHIFAIPDGAVAYGSGVDGRLLAVFPAAGNWGTRVDLRDPEVRTVIDGLDYPTRLMDRRELVAVRLEEALGPVLHNPTRGEFLLPNIRKFGAFLDEWAAIYERFGVPPDLGLAQAIVESGLNGTARSAARAVGFCQWLLPNWRQLQRLSPHPIEAYNQTTQAPYCAAYLAVLATKYGTFIPALSDHHAGGTNVGRTLINGTRLGGQAARDQYFLGSELARDLRLMAPGAYRDAYGSYGPRSFRYAEMVFGNTFTVARLRASVPQVRVYAMRMARAMTLTEISRQSGVPVAELRRYNPALVRRVPAGASLYLPKYVRAFGPDVSFWHRSPSATYTRVLGEFLAIDLPFSEWDSPAIVPTLSDFQRRFTQTRTEEGTVMATMLRYVIGDIQTSGRAAILTEFASSQQVQALFDQAVSERDAQRAVRVDESGLNDPTGDDPDAGVRP